MTISELISHLKLIQAAHGDLEVRAEPTAKGLAEDIYVIDESPDTPVVVIH